MLAGEMTGIGVSARLEVGEPAADDLRVVLVACARRLPERSESTSSAAGESAAMGEFAERKGGCGFDAL